MNRERAKQIAEEIMRKPENQQLILELSTTESIVDLIEEGIVSALIEEDTLSG